MHLQMYTLHHCCDAVAMCCSSLQKAVTVCSEKQVLVCGDGRTWRVASTAQDSSILNRYEDPKPERSYAFSRTSSRLVRMVCSKVMFTPSMFSTCSTYCKALFPKGQRETAPQLLRILSLLSKSPASCAVVSESRSQLT